MSQGSNLATFLIGAAATLAAAILPATQAATVKEYGVAKSFRVQPGAIDWSYFAFNQPSVVPAGLIQKDDDVSPGFLEEIKRGLAKIPVNILQALDRDGYQITLSKTVTEAVPAAKNQQVRGYQPHATWNTVYGMFNRTTGQIVMAEKAQQDDQYGRPVLMPLKDLQRREGIIRHECGHAVDQYLGHLSHSPEFKQAYDKGLKSISAPERKVLSYYLQPGDAGREETFAEIFASLNEYACDRSSDILLRNHFPELVKLIQTKAAAIKG